jgi:hypothetical protein
MNELINIFPNGQELYNTNANFNSILNYIYQGLDLYSAISIFAEENENMHKLVKELIDNMPMQPIMFKEG